MSAAIREQVIRPEDEDCVLDFLVKHDTAQIKIKLHAANGLMKKYIGVPGVRVLHLPRQQPCKYSLDDI